MTNNMVSLADLLLTYLGNNSTSNQPGIVMRAQALLYLDGVAENQMCHHGVTNKHHATDEAEMDEVRTRQGQGARHNSQARLEVHSLQHTPNEQQDVDAIQGVVPGQLVDQVLQLGKGCLQLE